MSNDYSDPRVFLTLPKEQRQCLLLAQAKELETFYQPGHTHIEWTETYLEDEPSEPLAQTR